jgi:hypothetical protein
MPDVLTDPGDLTELKRRLVEATRRSTLGKLDSATTTWFVAPVSISLHFWECRECLDIHCRPVRNAGQ